MAGLAALFPPPPEYYKGYTDERIEELRKFEGDNGAVPEHLQELLPPPIPETSAYRGFGSIWNTKERLMALEEANVPQLYDSAIINDHQLLVAELHKLLKSALANYLSLIGVLATDPQEFPSKVEDIRVIFINMHHLLNTYRLHETRESLLARMSHQIDGVRANTSAIRASNAAIKLRVQGYAKTVALETPKPVKKPSEWPIPLEADAHVQHMLEHDMTM